MNIEADPVKSWKAIRDLEVRLNCHHKKPRIIKMRKNDGSLATSNDESADILLLHFNKIFNNNNFSCEESVLPLLPDKPTMLHLNTPPSLDKVKSAIKKLRSQKAPGPTGITPDIIKSLTQPSLPNKHPHFLKDTELSNEFLHHLHHIITKFWNKEIPSCTEWQHGTLTPVPKKEDLSNPN